MKPVNPHSNSYEEEADPTQEAVALDAPAPTVKPAGVGHAGGTNSSAPLSGAVDERVSPSKSTVIEDIGCALLLAAKPSTCQSSAFVN